MKATLLLADFAKLSDGKIDAMGLGWTITVSPTPPAAVVLLLQVGWDETNHKHAVVLELVDADGQTVVMPTPGGPQPLRIEGEVEVGRPPGIPVGTAIDQPFAVGIGPGIPLVPGQRYEWRLSIGGEHREEWVAGFYVQR